jgi:ABC-type transport system involved in multi-copper enzyme maturation permease subunit
MGVSVLNPRNITLLGPLFRYEMLRSSRQMRCFSLRCVYGVALLVILYLVFASWFGWDGNDPRRSASSRGRVGGFSINDMAEFGRTFAYACLWVQLAAAVVLTPILTAGAITEERGRRTLDFVLLTHLKDREIIVGKLAARLAHVALILLTGMPVLGLVQLLGGVDPDLVLAAFAATFLMMVSIGSVAMYNSVQAYNTTQAIVATYGLCITYFAASLACLGCAAGTGFQWLGGFADGNPLAVVVREYGSNPRIVTPVGLLESMLRFTAFHCFAAILFCTGAVRRLRRHLDEPNRRLLRALRESHQNPSQSGPSVSVRRVDRPPAWPAHAENLMWRKELTFEGFHPAARSQRVALGCLIAIILPLICMPLVISWAESDRIHEENSLWVRAIGTFVSCILLWSISANAARSITREKTRRTLDSLLATSLENKTIVACKLFGSIFATRWACVLLGLFWACAVITGNLSSFGVFLLILAWCVLASMTATIGFWCSLVSRNTLRAKIYTLAILAGICVVPQICGLIANILHKAFGAQESVFSYIVRLSRGLSPPLMLWDLAFSDNSRLIEDASPAILGIAVYGVAALLLWRRLNTRFGPVTGRMPLNG